jgi:RimJ/RimL family protein N-acetyltransferase
MIGRRILFLEQESIPMYKDNNIYFEQCCPIEDHAKQVMEWRNDPVTLSMSYHHKPKIWSDFWNEFRSTYFNHNQEIHPVFAISDGRRAGFLKFSAVRHPNGLPNPTVDISINISPNERGKGLGVLVLKACIGYLWNKGIESVYAEVLSHNAASIKTFIASGFSFIEQKEKYVVDTGKSYSIQCFLIDIFNQNTSKVKNEKCQPIQSGQG